MHGGPSTGTRSGTNQVRSDNADATLATIYDAWVTPNGKFGQGLAFDKTTDDGRMKIEG